MDDKDIERIADAVIARIEQMRQVDEIADAVMRQLQGGTRMGQTAKEATVEGCDPVTSYVLCDPFGAEYGITMSIKLLTHAPPVIASSPEERLLAMTGKRNGCQQYSAPLNMCQSTDVECKKDGGGEFCVAKNKAVSSHRTPHSRLMGIPYFVPTASTLCGRAD
jgi:hypothetical protein